MSVLSIDTCYEWFAKAQNRFVNCFIRQIIPDSLQRRFRSVTFCGFGFSSWNVSKMAPPTRGSRRGSGMRWLAASSPCQWSLGSACRAICFVQLRNSFLKVVLSSVWRTSSKYNMKQQIRAKLYAKQMATFGSKIFTYFWDIVIVLGHIILPHPV